jgi:hypothetical protein
VGRDRAGHVLERLDLAGLLDEPHVGAGEVLDGRGEPALELLAGLGELGELVDDGGERGGVALDDLHEGIRRVEGPAAAVAHGQHAVGGAGLAPEHEPDLAQARGAEVPEEGVSGGLAGGLASQGQAIREVEGPLRADRVLEEPGVEPRGRRDPDRRAAPAADHGVAHPSMTRDPPELGPRGPLVQGLEHLPAELVDRLRGVARDAQVHDLVGEGPDLARLGPGAPGVAVEVEHAEEPHVPVRRERERRGGQAQADAEFQGGQFDHSVLAMMSRWARR